MKAPTLLIVDDEPYPRRFLTFVLQQHVGTLLEASSAAEAVRVLQQTPVELLFLDLRLPDESGMQLLERLSRLKLAGPVPEVVMMTGHGSVAAAVEAMRLGAADFLEKPFPGPEAVELVVRRVLKRRQLVEENERLRLALADRFGALVGRSEVMRKLFDVLERVAPMPVTVLIQGESGTGKELVARALHARSPRHERPFVAINCAALPPSLLETTLFGSEKGAYTGADRVRRGVFEEAEGGTLFLDELGDMPPELQRSLLRVLQERRFTRVGGTQEHTTDVRVVAATHRMLPELVREGRFREDLYYRLAVVVVQVPPLRERLEDLPLLVPELLRRAAERFQRPILPLDPEVLTCLAQHMWPGNVRELENVLQRMLVLSRGERLGLGDLPEELRRPEPPLTLALGADPLEERGPEPVFLSVEQLSRLPLAEAREQFERAYFQKLMQQVEGNVRSAAELAGIARQHLYRKLADYGLEPLKKGEGR